MLTLTVNGKEITISDMIAGMVTKHYNDRYSLKIGFETNTVLSEYEKECVGRKLVGLAAENERLKAKLDAVREWANCSTCFDDIGYQMARQSVMDIIDKEDDA
jgi:hypothetical protein